MKLYRYCLPLLVMAVALGLTGCDSGVAPTETTGDGQPTVQFAASGTAVTESDGSTTIDITISNPDGNPVNVDVIFAAPASGADTDDFSVQGGSLSPISGSDAFFVATVTFPANAEDGAIQSLTITDLSDDDIGEQRESAIFALQNIQTGGSATIGSPSSFDLSIGLPVLADVRASGVGTATTFSAIVTRVVGSEARVQDETAGIVITRRDDFASDVSRADRVLITGTVSEFAGQLQIDSDDLTSYEILSSGNDLPTPQTITLAEAVENADEYESELVRVEDITIDPDGDIVFQAGGSEGNYTVTDSEGNTLTLRIPGDSYYGGRSIPTDPITFEGVLGEFFGDIQLQAIDEGDIIGGDTGGGGPSVVSIEEARAQVDSGQTVIVEGIVTRNLDDNTQIQDETAGITISRRSDIVDAVNDGDRLRVTASVTEFRGLIQLDQDNVQNFEVVSTGNALPEPVEITLDQVADFQSELVRITGLEITSTSDDTFQGGGSAGNYDVTDGQTTITLRVESGSFYEGEPIPEGTFTFRGITGAFNGPQILPINEGDIITDGGGGEPNVVTIDAARQESNGTSVTVEGILTRKDGQNAYIQDDSGPTGASGIVVRDGDLADAIDGGSVAIGDRIQASGELGAFNGLIQISSNVSYSVVAEDVGLPAFQTVTVDELNANGEDYESELVEVTDLTIDPDGGDDDSNPDGEFKGGGGDGNYQVTDPNDNTIILRIPSSSFYVGEPIPEDPVTFTGVLGQFNGAGFGERDPDEGYQLTALNDGDITVQ